LNAGFGFLMPTDDPFAAAIGWIAGLLVGEVATTVAVIAIAAIGLATLQGYFSYRDCIRVIIGCALMFGASTIAQGFMEMTSGTEPGFETASPPPAPISHVHIATPSRVPEPYDPYAGASVPQ
jgi:type IV secretion system protein VirB2